MAKYTLRQINANLQYALGVLAETCQELEDENKELRAANESLNKLANQKPNKKVLRPSEVKEIRAAKRSGKYTNRELAAMYNVNPATISRTVRSIYHAEV